IENRDDIGTGALVTIYLILAVILLLSVYFVRNTIRKSHVRIMVFPAGLIQTHRDEFVFLRWDEISIVWQAAMDIFIHGVKTATTQKFTIETEQGERLVFDSDLKKVSELGQIIEQEVTPRLLGLALETLAAMDMVSFG